MARLLGPDENSRLVYGTPGTSFRNYKGATAHVYADAAGTIPADIAAYDPANPTVPGASIPGATLAVDAYSRMPLFWFPDGVDVLYVTVGTGPLARIDARLDARVDVLETAVGPGVVHTSGNETIADTKTFTSPPVLPAASFGSPTTQTTFGSSATDGLAGTVARSDHGHSTPPLGTTAGSAAAGDDTRIVGAAQVSANLSDLASPSAARTNLGLGTAAVADVPASGNATSGQVVLGADTRLSNTRTPTDGSVTAAKLAAGAVTAGSIAAGTIVDADVSATTGIAQTKVAGLTAALVAKADLVGGTIPTAQLPAIAITDFLGTVASQAAMLALVGHQGDWCNRSDLGASFILAANDATVLSNWVQVLAPSGAGAVSSVNSQTGVVVLGYTDVGAASTTDPRLSDTRTPTDGSVTTAKLASGAVTSATIADGTITNADISASAAIAASKISGTALVASGNLADVASAATALTNLGGAPLTVGGKGVVREDELVYNVEIYATGNANYYNAGTGHWYADAGLTTLAADDTAAIRALVTGGAKHLWFGSKQYRIKWTEQTSFLSWVSVNGVTLRGNGANLCDETVYTISPAIPTTPVFNFSGCKNIVVEGVDYIGPPFSSPTTQVGYQGGTFVRAINGTDGVRVRARLSNLRYGIQTGDYADYTQGGCRNFDVDLITSFCGYPWASYRADNVKLNIDASDVHRAAYIAGTNNVTGVIKWQNQYIADTVVLITDCITSGTDTAAQADPVGHPTTSRGCVNLDITSIDKGSTVVQSSTRCAGIGLSRVDPGTQFRNIAVRVHSVATSTQSPTVGAFMVTSGAPSVWSRYPFNWESTILLENITISGVIDHSGTTASGNSGSELYIYTYDTSSVHAATVRDMKIDGLTILPAGSPGVTRASVMAVPGTAGSPVLDRFVTPGMTFQPYCNTYAFLLRGCVIGTLDLQGGGTWVDLSAGTTVTSTAGIVGAKITAMNSAMIGGGLQVRRVEKSLILSGTTSTWTPAIPAGATVLGLQGRIINTTLGPTGYTVGPSGGPGDKYATVNTLAFGSTWGPAQANTAAEPYVRLYQTATDIVVTAASGVAFTQGGMRLVLWYLDIGTLSA